MRCLLTLSLGLMACGKTAPLGPSAAPRPDEGQLPTVTTSVQPKAPLPAPGTHPPLAQAISADSAANGSLTVAVGGRAYVFPRGHGGEGADLAAEPVALELQGVRCVAPNAALSEQAMVRIVDARFGVPEPEPLDQPWLCGQGMFPQSLLNEVPVADVVSHGSQCFATVSGSLWCHSRDWSWFEIAMPDVAQIRDTAQTTCVRSTAGQLRCWGYTSDGTESEYAALGDGRFERYRADEPPVMATGVRHFDIGGDGRVCFVRAEGNAACLVHDNLPPLGTPKAGVISLENLRSAQQIAVDYQQVCVLHEGDRVTCFTSAGRRTTQLPS